MKESWLLGLVKNASVLTYLLILFFLPTQLGLHFWPDFTSVLGIRIDYLSPTLFFTDILIAMLLSLFFIETLITKKPVLKREKSFSRVAQVLLGFFLWIVISSLFSKSFPLGIYGVVRFAEIVFFAWYTIRILQETFLKKYILIVCLFSFLLQCVIALWQFYLQHSTGLFYFLGERDITTSTPGAATAVLAGEVVLRPYGTFSHPNALAGYVLLFLIFFTRQFFQMYNSKIKWLLAVAYLFGSLILFLTLSRITIAVFVFLLVYLIVSVVARRKVDLKKIIRKRMLPFSLLCIGGLVAFVVLSPVLLERFFLDSFVEVSYGERIELAKSAFTMTVSNPFFGVGPNSFIPSLPEYSQSATLLLQPVHSLFLLLSSEIGVVGLGFFLALVVLAYKQRDNNSVNSVFGLTMLLTLLVLGSFDHYFLTQQQGRLLLGLAFGICFTQQGNRLFAHRSMKNTKKNFFRK